VSTSLPRTGLRPGCNEPIIATGGVIKMGADPHPGQGGVSGDGFSRSPRALSSEASRRKRGDIYLSSSDLRQVSTVQWPSPNRPSDSSAMANEAFTGTGPIVTMEVDPDSSQCEVHCAGPWLGLIAHV
jgi:hypothetical protein